MFQFVQKLAYYPQKLAAFRAGDHAKTLSTVIFYPSTEACNQNCVFCDSKFYDLKKLEFDRDRMARMLDDMNALGADSLIILGDGSEPILFRDLGWLVDEAAARGIACGIYTNGSLCTQELADCLNKMEFVRISLDAGTPETHSLLHGYPLRRGDFASALALLRKLDPDRVETGAAFIILEENVGEIYLTWKLLCSLRARYLELKLPLQKGYRFASSDARLIGRIREELTKIDRERQTCGGACTEVVLNNHLRRVFTEGCAPEFLTSKEESPCLTCCFRTIVSPMGYYLCSPLKNLEDARYGDPFAMGLREAWESARHMEMIGRPCAISCTYNDQNEALLRLASGGTLPEAGVSGGQRHFL